MDNSEEEEEFYDAPDAFVELYCEEENSPATPQSDFVPPPGDVTVLHVGSETVSFGLAPTDSSVRYTLHIDYSCDTHSGGVIMEDSSTVDVDGLLPGTEYTFRIRRAENGNESEAACVSVCTEPSPPVQVIVYQVSSESLSLYWDIPAGEVENYIVTCSSEEDSSVQELTTDTNSLTVSSLKPGVCYSLQVSTQPKNGRRNMLPLTSSRTSK
ncbi:interferon-induced very large GTPase 1-like [Scomber scombrus]|uniref:Interferon-induced very large GTPase 1-like n=1 Tax=Scomber scombrus TaxID=13677 RepID=A0AAV1QJ57_SCOSC